MVFQRGVRNNPNKGNPEDRCKRCGVKRDDLRPSYMIGYPTTGVIFNHGHCMKCWGLVYQYGGNEELCKVHEATQQLKTESANVKRKKHRRPA